MKLLLEADGINVNATDKDGHSALMGAAILGNTDAVKLLLEADGINVRATDKRGRTALTCAQTTTAVQRVADGKVGPRREAAGEARDHGSRNPGVPETR